MTYNWVKLSFVILSILLGLIALTGSITTTSLYHSEKLLALLEMDQQGQLIACKLEHMENIMKKQPILNSWRAAGLDVRRLKFKDMVDLIFRCQDVPNDDLMGLVSDGEEETDFRPPGHENIGILPDTNWCGFGRAAISYGGLGSAVELDKCCRAHDYCPVYSMRLSQDNPTPYTQVHCLCDQMFYQCLKNVGTSLADTVGQIFFNIVNMKCLNFVMDGNKCSLSIRGRCVWWKGGERSDNPRIVIMDNSLKY